MKIPKGAVLVLQVKQGWDQSVKAMERGLDELGLELVSFLNDEEAAQKFTERLPERRTKEPDSEPVTMRERPREPMSSGAAVSTASKQLIALVERCMTERKVGYIKASEIVGKEHPALYQEWLVESYTEAGQARVAQIQAAENANQSGFPNRPTRQVRPVAGERLMQAIDLVMRDRNVTHEAASQIVCDERPDLYEAYRRETYGTGTPIPGIRMQPGEEIV